MEKQGKRLDGLDTLRGLTLLSMIAYHACWDLVYLFGFRHWTWYDSTGAFLWQQSICWTFILLSGFCFHLGHHRLRRGLLSFGGGILVSLVTILFMPESRIFFGVLSLLGSAALLTIPLDRLFRRWDPRAGLALCFGAFLLTRQINRGYLGLFQNHPILRLPAWLYASDFTACFGFPPPRFFSTDYFSLLPWLFLFWTGYFLYRLRRWNIPSLRLPLITAMGRRSLLIYLLHQPVVYGVLFLLFRGR